MTTQPELPFNILRFSPKSGEEKKNSAIIVMQEWWGVNDQIKMHAQRIADNTQTLAVVPDLYKGKLGLSREEATHLSSNLNWNEALSELEILVDFLRKENREKIGAIGFCMGGAMSVALAARLASKTPLSAAVTCYGVPLNTRVQVDLSTIAIKTPVQGHFGIEDKSVGFSDTGAANSLQRQLEEGVERADVEGHEINIYHYEGEGHGFLNDEEWAVQKRKEMGFVGGDNKESQDLAWGRTYEFFNKYLV